MPRRLLGVIAAGATERLQHAHAVLVEVGSELPGRLTLHPRALFWRARARTPLSLSEAEYTVNHIACAPVCFIVVQIGIDVAWSKISAEPHHLSDEQLQQIVAEMTKGLDLEHPNIIKCFECWEDKQHHCINLITELFTSGNLRQYRNLHKHLDLKVRAARVGFGGRGAGFWGARVLLGF